MNRLIIKILAMIVIVILVVSIIGFYYFNSAYNKDQITMQYDEEVISQGKRTLDFSPYGTDLETFTKERYDIVHGLLQGTDIETQQSLIKNRMLSCEDVTLYYLARIQKYNDQLNAVIQLNPFALEEARAIDESLSEGENVGNLFSTTVLLKDNIATINMNVASGAYALKDTTTTRDAFVAKSLKDNGCIILGKANLSEWSNYLSLPSSNGFSVLGGQTKNPYGKFDVGGSSSGSSAGVSAGLSNITIGSETAGSLIFPAGQNSVVCLKPTIGLLSRDLIIPISEAQDTAGVEAKSVRDLYVTYKDIIGVDVHDSASEIINRLVDKTSQLDENYLEGKRFVFVDNGSDEMKTIRKQFEDAGAILINGQVDDSLGSIDIETVLAYGMVHDVKAFLNNEAVNTPFKSLDEIVTYNNEDPTLRIPYGQYLLEYALSQDTDENTYHSLVASNKISGAKMIDTLLTDNDAIAIISMSNDISGVYAPAGYPALTVPSGYKASGEPYGVTIVGSELDDFMLIDIAYAYESQTKARKYPDNYID